MKWSFFLFLHICFLTLTSSCSDTSSHAQEQKQWMSANGKVKVLSTTAMIDDLVKQVGGEHIDTIVLIKGELDPHSYQLVKGDNEKLFFADLIFSNGLGLEHGPSLQQYLKQHKKVISLGDLLLTQDPTFLIYYKGQLDPHIWMDMSLWSKTVPIIVSTLSEKDPSHAEEYQANGNQLLSDLRKAHESIKEQLQAIPSQKRYLVTSHDAFNYFTRAYLANEGEPSEVWRERFMAPEGLAPESQISATDIQETVSHLQKHHILVLFPESNVNRDSIYKIVQAAKEKGLDVEVADIALYADAMGSPGSDGDTYIKMITHSAHTIKSYLNKDNP